MNVYCRGLFVVLALQTAQNVLSVQLLNSESILSPYTVKKLKTAATN